MKKFLTLFPATGNLHLVKDVGMIPFIMNKEGKFDACLACYDNGDYDYLQSETPGLKLHFIRRVFNNHLLDGLIFLLFNSHKFDILQVYHLKDISLIWARLFDLLGPGQHKTYLKMDADKGLHQYPLQGIKGRLRKAFLKKISLITVENTEYQQILNRENTLGRQVEYCPNGFYDNGIRANQPFEEKENTILTVGRIGVTQKATDVLFEGFRRFAETDNIWKLEVLGPIDPGFQGYIASFFQDNPHLRSRINFTGAVIDRDLLWSHYKKAKVFVLTSRWEGFPLVFTEAMKAGCFIVSSDIPAAHDVVNENRYGLLFPVDDAPALSKALQLAVSDQQQLAKVCRDIQDYAYDNFYWPAICQRLHKLLS